MNSLAKTGLIVLIMISALFAPQRPAAGAIGDAAAAAGMAPASVTLSLSEATVRPGESLTLSASYVNLGLVNTYLTVTPSSAVRFTPDVPSPCRYDVHPDSCKTFPLQALITGTVTFQARANGETFDDDCQCFRFVNVNSPPVTLTISGPPNFPPPPRAYLPMMVDNSSGSALAGRMIFTSSRDTAYEIHSMGADGSNIRRLTNNDYHDSEGDISPDGTKIVFQARYEGDALYVMNIDGTNQRRLSAPGTSVWDQEPAWSPDGSKIAFTSTRDGNAEIYVMNADGSGARRLTTTARESYDSAPAWSPDGSKIAFTSTRDSGDPPSIYLMNSDGTDQRRLTNGADRWPVWSPDGQQIAFISFENYKGSVYRIRSDGTQRTRVTTGHDVYDKAVWSPAGDMLAFTSTGPHALSAIHVVNLDGSGLRTVVQRDAQNAINDWAP
ncbi:MAG TPA: DPP IV N-terminal domain-containing protein [Herpetosiphonaceae bacterium]